MTQVEFDKLAEELLRRLEPMIRKEIEHCLEESITNCLQHLGSEMETFARMRRQGPI